MSVNPYEPGLAEKSSDNVGYKIRFGEVVLILAVALSILITFGGHFANDRRWLERPGADPYDGRYNRFGLFCIWQVALFLVTSIATIVLVTYRLATTAERGRANVIVLLVLWLVVALITVVGIPFMVIVGPDIWGKPPPLQPP